VSVMQVAVLFNRTELKIGVDRSLDSEEPAIVMEAFIRTSQGGGKFDFRTGAGAKGRFLSVISPLFLVLLAGSLPRLGCQQAGAMYNPSTYSAVSTFHVQLG